MRYLSPMAFLAVGAFVAWFNMTHGGEVILLPFLGRLFPSLQNDLPAQGQLSALLFILAGVGLLILVLARSFRERAARRQRGQAGQARP